MSATDLQRLGRDCYKRQDYAKALEYFNRAVGKGDATPQLLDNLAATHDKLKNLPAALKTAKRAIQAGREDATGYLRAGIILKKMEKPSVALEIYAHGLRSIKHVGQGYEHLEKAHDDLQQQLAPKKSIDPLTVLPRELANLVLEYLSFRQRTAICRVSKGWRQFMRSEPTLWSHLDLSAARAKVSTRFVSTTINTAREKLTTATLNRLFDFDKVLTAVAPRVRSLTLTGTGLQGSNLVKALQSCRDLRELRILPGTEISSPRILQEIIDLRPELELLHCTVFGNVVFDQWTLGPNIRSLNLSGNALLNSQVVLQALSQATALEELTLWGARGDHIPVSLDKCTKLQHLRILAPIYTHEHFHLPPSLKTLTLHTSRHGATPGADFFMSGRFAGPSFTGELSMLDLPELEDLDFRLPGLKFSNFMDEFSVTSRIDCAPPTLSKLRSLIMHAPVCDELSVPARMAELQRLSLLECYELKDDYVESILRQFQHLHYLDISGSSVTGVAVKEVVKAGHVRELVVNGCHKIGRDAVDWARCQGLKVEFRIMNNETGKKLRQF